MDIEVDATDERSWDEMSSKDLIEENLRRSELIVLSRIDDMRTFATTPPTSRGGGHTLWVLGHLAFIEGLVIQRFMLGRANPYADWESMFDGDTVEPNPSAFVSFDVALRACRDARRGTLELLRSFSESDLDHESLEAPGEAMDLFGTFRRCFQYASDHWLMHRGQLANARLAAGLEPMWY